MKRLIIFALAATMGITACTDKKTAQVEQTKGDSLQQVIAARDNEINDMLGTLNEIQDGLQAITQAEGKMAVIKDGDATNKTDLLKQDVKFIADKMEQNRELIKKLRQQMRESGFKGDQLKKTIDGLVVQLNERDKQLQQLRQELDAKDIHIAELDNTITSLHDDVSSLSDDVENLKTESSQKTETINNQDKQLNTAWFAFGSKKELKEQGILESGEVLRGNFNKNYFTKIDIRVNTEIKLYSKYAKVLTTHPAGSYNLQKDSNGQYVLRITNPQIFWSTSKYLVVRVK